MAAGDGTRFGAPKWNVQLGGKPLLQWSLQLLTRCAEIDSIVVVARATDCTAVQKLCSKFTKVTVTDGGDSRFASSAAGVAAAGNAELLLFHNVANPLLTADEVSTTITAARECGAAGVAHAVVSTLRSADGVVPRDGLWAMETPQVIAREIWQRGAAAMPAGAVPTDDLQLAEWAGVKPQICAASPRNHKITTPADLPAPTRHAVGIGADSHRFADDGELTLGGVQLADAPALRANSDGDAALHALCNALSSALGGHSFSAVADKLCAAGERDSAAYLQYFVDAVAARSATIEQISIAIEAERPRLEAHLPAMAARIAELCGVAQERVGITVTSGERLTAAGRGEGVVVQAVATIGFY